MSSSRRSREGPSIVENPPGSHGRLTQVAASGYPPGRRDLSADDLRRTMPIHPTVAELLPTLAGRLKPAD